MTLTSKSALAQDLLYQKRYSEAEALSRETLEVQQRVMGPDSKATLDTANNLGWAYAKQHRYAEAGNMFGESLAIERRVYGENDPFTNTAMYNLACVKALDGRREEAVAMLRQAVDHGFRNAEAMAGDEDLKSVRGDKRFDAILADARKPAAVK
jgi:tetratricopeptide (TPR) repeat protein